MPRGAPSPEPSYPAHAGYPVRRGLSAQSPTSLEYWITRIRGRLVIASEAKQSIPPRKRKLDCFVESAPRNDGAQ
jgi:hypothetical protein